MRKTRALFALVFALLLPLSAFASDWEWTSEPTPGAQNVFSNDEGEEESGEETFEDGDLADTILLSELMPNPEGTDTDTEWIEIYNTGTEDVDLGNWQLDDAEGGSDPYVFPAGTTIEAQDFLVIYRSESDLALNNDTDEVRLFNYEGELQDSVVYDGSPEGESYARIITNEDNEQANLGLLARLFTIPTAQASDLRDAPWEWTQSVTEGSLNPVYHFIEGTVLELVPFEDKVTLQTKNETLEVSLVALDLNETLKTSLFKPGSTISGYATESSDGFLLQRFDDLTPETFTAQTSHLKTILLICAALACGLAALYFYGPFNKKTQGTKHPQPGL